jgi:hypothetical protein
VVPSAASATTVTSELRSRYARIALPVILVVVDQLTR